MENRYCVIMCGGVGSRFWPFSKTAVPKQFLDFFGTGRTLLQMTYDRISSIIPARNILALTNERYAPLVKQQLPDLDDEQILLEPDRRNTAPCIAWSAYHIRAFNPDALILVTPSDHLILKDEEFRNSVVRGFEFVRDNRSALLTMGIKPNRPETGYGYIQVGGKSLDSIAPVKTFTEKPNAELAKVLYESGEFLWNSGIFLWNIRAIRKAFRAHQPSIADVFKRGDELMNTPEEEAFIQEMFPTCPNISLDYGIMEKASDVRVIYADFGWSDLGTWGSLYDLGTKDEHRNVSLHGNTMFYESNGNVVTLPDGNLAVIEGLQDMIVAQNDNVLLICRKQNEQSIRQIVADVDNKFGNQYT